jgi:hypothetical protein
MLREWILPGERAKMPNSASTSVLDDSWLFPWFFDAEFKIHF